jgi:menaquinone reductase, multiheme cytochrome c subunit
VNPRTLMAFGVGFGAALAAGWIGLPRVLYRSVEQPIQFSHVTHTGEAVGMSCQDCHTLQEDGKFTGLPRLDLCAPCHTDAIGESADEARMIRDYVTPGVEIPWLVYARQPENVHFPHAPHIALAKLECEACHGAHGSTAALRPLQRNRLSTYSRDIEGRLLVRASAFDRGMKMNDCSRCHRKSGVEESCLTCHK